MMDKYLFAYVSNGSLFYIFLNEINLNIIIFLSFESLLSLFSKYLTHFLFSKCALAYPDVREYTLLVK